jgi:hypothetical protein
MFKTTPKEKQLDLFGSVGCLVTGRSEKKLKDSSEWHNLFREEVVNRVDESVFNVLYSSKMGAPNSPIRVLVGMMVLKEAFDWSDSQMYDQCQFNLLVRNALGLYNLSDAVPTTSTFYLFKSRLVEHQMKTGADLVKDVFQEITKGQIKHYQVNGKSIRMDSKLIGSNIAWCNRYELVHSTLKVFCKTLDSKGFSRLSDGDVSELAKISNTSGDKFTFYHSREEVKQRFVELGGLIQRILSAFSEKDNKEYAVLLRVFGEQYTVRPSGLPEPQDPKNIDSDSLQSPHDPDCAYRKKSGESIKGYSVNVTETCDEKGLNLIADIQLEKANVPDIEFVEPALENTVEVLGRVPEKMFSDGAFHSPDNVKYCRKAEIDPIFTGIQGKPSRYDLTLDGKELLVNDTKTGTVTRVMQNKKGKWGYKVGKNYRYFTEIQVMASEMRRKISNMPKQTANRRNNVEATIFQLSYHLNNNKSKYRGKFRHKMWAWWRALWVNLRRIYIFMGDLPVNHVFTNILLIKSNFFRPFIPLLAKLKQLMRIFSASIRKISAPWSISAPFSNYFSEGTQN